MPIQAINSRSAGETVSGREIEVTARAGSVRIVSPALFSRGDETVFPPLFERLFAVKAVEAVEVDRGGGVVTVMFNRHSVSPSDLLSQLAAATRCDRAATAELLPREMDLRQIPGRVTRIERHRRAGWAMTTIISVGTGLLTSYAKLAGRATGNGPIRNGTDESRVVVLEGLAVHFQPRQTISVATDPQSIAGDPAERNRIAAGSDHADLHGETVTHQVIVARGVRRLAHLAAAGGCFAMSFVGLVTPGIPTVPFVLATSYFLVRSSPALDDRLRRSRLFGQMVRDWETYGGMRRSTKNRLIAFTLAIVVVTILIAEPSVPLLAVVTVMGTLGVGLIVQFPTVAEDAPDARVAFAPA